MSHYPREISQFRAISHMDELHNLDFLIFQVLIQKFDVLLGCKTFEHF